MRVADALRWAGRVAAYCEGRRRIAAERGGPASPPPPADRLALVQGVVTSKERDRFAAGDRAIDSVIPEAALAGRAELEILRKSDFRVKSAKIRRRLSQGILFTMDILRPASGEMSCVASPDAALRHGGMAEAEWGALPEGTDVPASRSAPFPHFVPKTDEER
eukprot:gene9249-38849_t